MTEVGTRYLEQYLYYPQGYLAWWAGQQGPHGRGGARPLSFALGLRSARDTDILAQDVSGNCNLDVSNYSIKSKVTV